MKLGKYDVLRNAAAACQSDAGLTRYTYVDPRTGVLTANLTKEDAVTLLIEARWNTNFYLQVAQDEDGTWCLAGEMLSFVGLDGETEMVVFY